MEIVIVESSPGELDGLSEEEISRRLRALLVDNLPPEISNLLAKSAPSPCGCGDHAHHSCGDDLRKSDRPRGGEIQLVEDLARLTLEGYESTMRRMSKKIVRQADAAVEAEGSPP